ncbi:MAG: hypothetical protein JWQ09_1129 [Segetibacter sp.]|nr:hypothetical protein [Segetibacter sp.]
MIFKGHDPDIERQDFLELLLEQVFPNYKVIDIVPWSFVSVAGVGFTANNNVLYYGELFNQNGANAKLNSVSFPLPVLSAPLKCFFTDLADATETYNFAGWKISFANSTNSVTSTAPAMTVIVPNITEQVTLFYDASEGKLALKIASTLDNTVYKVGVYFDGNNTPAYFVSITDAAAGYLFTDSIIGFNMVKLAYVLISDTTKRGDFYVVQNNGYDVKPYNIVTYTPTLRIDQVNIADVCTVSGTYDDGSVHSFGPSDAWTIVISGIGNSGSPYPVSLSVLVVHHGFTCPFLFTEHS